MRHDAMIYFARYTPTPQLTIPIAHPQIIRHYPYRRQDILVAENLIQHVPNRTSPGLPAALR